MTDRSLLTGACRTAGVALVAALFVAVPDPIGAQESDEATAESDEATAESDEGSDSDAAEESSSPSSQSKLQRGDQMEFDARLIRGERASGAVFLFQRTPRKLPSMVERRRTYLEESVRGLLGGMWAKSFRNERREGADDGGEESNEKSSDDPGDIIDRLATD